MRVSRIPVRLIPGPFLYYLHTITIITKPLVRLLLVNRNKHDNIQTHTHDYSFG